MGSAQREGVERSRTELKMNLEFLNEASFLLLRTSSIKGGQLINLFYVVLSGNRAN
jgi:hypothetical protein